jgi:hypothetical protein
MFEQIKAHLGEPAVFVGQGIVIGALLASSLAGSPATAVTTYTRAVSCHGLAWQPISYQTQHTATGTLRSSGSTGYFICNPALPHKAVVTRVRFTLYDIAAAGWVDNCALVRAGLAPTTAAAAQVMASVGQTQSLGTVQRFEDTTIDFATVDNMNYAYYLQCQIRLGSPNQQGIYGADITYKITAGNG